MATKSRKTRKMRAKDADDPSPKDMTPQGQQTVAAAVAAVACHFREMTFDNVATEAPATARLLRVLVNQVADGFEALTSAGEPSSDEIVKRAKYNIEQLHTWLLPPGRPAPTEPLLTGRPFFEQLLRSGTISLAEFDAGSEEISKARRGAPVRTRHIAVEALNLHTMNPKKWPWRKLAQRFCKQTGCEHADDCRARLRQSVRLLENFLRDCQG